MFQKEVILRQEHGHICCVFLQRAEGHVFVHIKVVLYRKKAVNKKSASL